MSKDFKYWLWIFYPVGVFFAMLFSYNLVFSVDANKWAEANIKRKQVTEENIRLAKLKDKLGLLEKIDSDGYLTDLKVLLQAIPSSKKPWLTLAEINLAASRSGVAFSGFNGQAGEIREASESGKGDIKQLYVKTSLETEDFESLRNFLRQLYDFKPLVGVRSLVWEDGEIDIEVEVGYQPWPIIDNNPESELKGNSSLKDKILTEVKEFEDITVYNTYQGLPILEGTENISPF